MDNELTKSIKNIMIACVTAAFTLGFSVGVIVVIGSGWVK